MKSKFSEAQIAFILKQAEDGTSVGEVCRKAGISEATFGCAQRSVYLPWKMPANSACRSRGGRPHQFDTGFLEELSS